ncbi:MAG: hypothetical protein CVT94_13300 [Bacteroidetes bacterium HGW-Bacteroidetes-11]|nr:MAG: hypothetical protein CVT94_13300 [Bacteroidetes bacterium HGW-Bacteroidetes-11]
MSFEEWFYVFISQSGYIYPLAISIISSITDLILTPNIETFGISRPSIKLITFLEILRRNVDAD